MTTPGFRPTHVVPQQGMPAWEMPDPAAATVPLDPLLPVQLIDRRGDWGRILCSNGWTAWVDGRLLIAVPRDPPTADGPLGSGDDPRPLLARAESDLARYRAAVDDLASGGLDRETFCNRTRDLRIGLVVDGTDIWLYDAEQGRWAYGDGTRLSTYATDAGPRTTAPPSHAPTRVVAPGGER